MVSRIAKIDGLGIFWKTFWKSQEKIVFFEYEPYFFYMRIIWKKFPLASFACNIIWMLLALFLTFWYNHSKNYQLDEWKYIFSARYNFLDNFYHLSRIFSLISFKFCYKNYHLIVSWIIACIRICNALILWI